MIIKAINYTHGLQDFSIGMMCKFDCIPSIVNSVKKDYNFIQVAICALSPKKTGNIQ